MKNLGDILEEITLFLEKNEVAIYVKRGNLAFAKRGNGESFDVRVLDVDYLGSSAALAGILLPNDNSDDEDSEDSMNYSGDYFGTCD